MSAAQAHSTDQVVSEQYSVILTGKLLDGFNWPEVKSAVAKAFKLDEARVDKMFSGKPVSIRRGVDQSQAEKLQAALLRMGAEAIVKAAPSEAGAVAANSEQQNAEEPKAEESITEERASDTSTTELTCPRCGHEQPHTTSCGLCKMDLRLHLIRVARRERIRAFQRQS